MLNKVLGFLTAIGTFAALLYRGNAHKANAEQQEQRAEAAESGVEIRNQIDDASRELAKKHKQENRDAEAAHDDDRRDHLNNKW